MRTSKIYTLIPSLLLLVLELMACQPQTVIETRVVETQVTRVVEVEGEQVVVTQVVEVAGVPDTASGSDIASSSSTSQTQSGMIIKDGNMTLMVVDTDAAAAKAVDLVLEFGGYVIDQRVWTGERNFRYASLQLGIPADEFENTMGAFRTLGTVMEESASGQDVTDEYFDLNSHLGNLYATQEQLRTFLSQATNTEETLAVYEELAKVESEINAIQGRIQYLSDRASYSTITLNLNPLIPTPTPIPPEADEWQPGRTAERAMVNLQNTAQNTADWAIYSSISCGPWLIAAAILGLFVWRGVAWYKRRTTWPAVAPTAQEESK